MCSHDAAVDFFRRLLPGLGVGVFRILRAGPFEAGFQQHFLKILARCQPIAETTGRPETTIVDADALLQRLRG